MLLLNTTPDRGDVDLTIAASHAPHVTSIDGVRHTTLWCRPKYQEVHRSICAARSYYLCGVSVLLVCRLPDILS